MKKLFILSFVLIKLGISANAQTTGPFSELYPTYPLFFSNPLPPFDSNFKIAAAGDINQDGYNDIVLSGGNFSTTTDTWLAIYYGNCTGGLGQVQDTIEITGINIVTALELVDYNNDTHPDILMAGDDSIIYLQGTSSGVFASPIYSPITFTIPFSERKYMAVADFNNDSHPDIYMNASDFSFQYAESILLYGSASGTFTNSGLPFNQIYLGYCIARDFNGDTFPDVLCADGSLILNNNGVLDVNTTTFYQLNGTRRIESVNSDMDSLWEVYAAFDHTFYYGEVDVNNLVTPTGITLSDSIVSFTVNDFDNDGFKDDVAVELIDSVVYLKGNAGVLTLQPNQGFASAGGSMIPNMFLSTDINNDNNPELFSTHGKVMWRNFSQFRYSVFNAIPIKGTFAYSTSADFDKDGFDDFAMYTKFTPTSMTVIFGGQCGIREIREFSSGVGFGAGYELEAGNFNNDTFPDLILSTTIYDTVYVFLNSGNGNFNPRTGYYVGHNEQQLAIADFNEDGLDDVFMLSTSPGRFNICTANASGNGTLNPASPLQNASGSSANVATYNPEPGDLNNDGHTDVIVTHNNALLKEMTIYYGDGNGNFPDSIIATIPLGNSINYCMPLHLNGDGNMDVLATDGTNITYTICRDSTASFLWSMCQPVNLPFGMQSIGSADFNNDSINDFVANAASLTTGRSIVGIVKPDYSVYNVQEINSGYNKSSIADFDNDGNKDIGWGTGSAFYIYNNDLPFPPMIVFQNDTIFSTPMRLASNVSSTPSSYEWYKDNMLLSGFNQAYFPSPLPGLYHVGVTYTNGAYSTASIRILPVGLTEIMIENNFQLSPNPVTDKLKILSQQVVEQIKIYSSSGKLINTSGTINTKNIELNLSDLPQGLYFLEVFAGGKYSYKKFIRM